MAGPTYDNSSEAGRFFIAIGRVGYLTLLAAVTLALLTAAQISTAYLGATGAEKGVSAVAIADAANGLGENKKYFQRLNDLISRQRSNQLTGIAIASDAGIYKYAYTVAFRRVVLGCYPDSFTARDPQTGIEASDLSWDASVAIYKAAKALEPEDVGGAGCASNVDPNVIVQRFMHVAQGSEAVSDGAFRAAAFGEIFVDCVKELNEAPTQLECAWSNLTRSVGLSEVASRNQTGLQNALNASRSGLADLATDRAQLPGLASPEGLSAVAAYRSLRGDEEPGNVPGRDETAPISLPWLGALIAALVVIPVLAQSALMAMFAGALGGGVANIWEGLGYGDGSESPLDKLAGTMQVVRRKLEAVAASTSQSHDMAAVLVSLKETAAELNRINAQTPDRSSLLTATFLGAVAALIIWLLTTGGLFVLSGGDANSAASPNVLLAIALVAGLARAKVINLTFDIANKIFASRPPDPSDGSPADAQASPAGGGLAPVAGGAANGPADSPI